LEASFGVEPWVLFQGLFEHSPVAYALFGPEGQVTSVNPAYVEMFGMAPPPGYNLFADELLPQVGLSETLRRAYAGETLTAPAFSYDPRQLRHIEVPLDARPVTIACTFIPFRSSGGDIAQVLIAYRDVTAETEATSRAWQERARLEGVVENAPAAVLLFEGREHLCVLSNRESHRLFGKQSELGQPAQGLAEVLNRAYATGKPIRSREERVRTHEGGANPEAYLDLVSQPLFDTSHQVEGIAVFGFDVTALVEARQRAEAFGLERNRALEELGRTEQRYRSLVEATSEIVFDTDPAGGFHRPQPGWATFTGQREEDYRGWGWLSAVHPEDRSTTTRTWQEALGRGSSYQAHMRVRRKDGSYRHMQVRAVPVRETDGSIREWVGVHRDITNQVESLDRERLTHRRVTLLADAGKRLFSSLNVETTLSQVASLVVEELADACLIDLIDETGDLRPVAFAHRNPAKEREIGELNKRFGLQASRHLRDEVIRTRRTKTWSSPPFERHVGRMQTAEHEERLRAFSTTAVAIVPLLFRGEALGTLAINSTRPGNPFSEEELALFEEVAARAAVALEHSRLYREAKKAIQLRDDFLSVASHELKTPMTALGLHLDSLGRALPRSPSMDRRVETLRRQVSRLGSLVEGLLDVSRISSGRLTLHLESVELMTLVAEMVARMGPEAERAGSRIELSGPPSLEGRWDRLRLEQVMVNLLSNAIKYGGGRPIQVSVAERGKAVECVVRDQGIGIPPEALLRIFQRFERAVSDRHYGGMGLGLYVTQQIVEAMGGTVSAQSEPGAGTALTVTLPRHPDSP
jgi:PAS domain S-box-containing protein